MKKKVKKVIHCVGVFYLQPNKNKQAGKRTGEHKSGRGISPNSPHLLLGRRQPTAQLDPRRTFRFQVNTHKRHQKHEKSLGRGGRKEASASDVLRTGKLRRLTTTRTTNVWLFAAARGRPASPRVERRIMPAVRTRARPAG